MMMKAVIAFCVLTFFIAAPAATTPASPVQELAIPNTEPLRVTSTVLENGVEYLIEASGIFDDWGHDEYGIDAAYCFAEWRVGSSPAAWQQLRIVDGDEEKGLIDLAGGDLPYHPEHLYRVRLTGKGRPLIFFMSDAVGSAGDNKGAVTVRIFRGGDRIPAENRDARAEAASITAWHGRRMDGWDFTVTNPRVLPDSVVRFDYAAKSTHGTETRNGTIEVTVAGRRLRGVLLSAGGESRLELEAVIHPDGRFASATGLIWSASDPALQAGWWATFEPGQPFSARERYNLNTASVADLVAAGLSERGARSVVQGRISWGPYPSIEEALGAPYLTLGDKERLKDRTTIGDAAARGAGGNSNRGSSGQTSAGARRQAR